MWFSNKLRQPWLGMELGNLHNSTEGFLEKISRKFPNILKGIVVNELMKESWDKVGKGVEMVVVLEDTDPPVHTSILVGEITPDKFYSWENMWNYVQ